MNNFASNNQPAEIMGMQKLNLEYLSSICEKYVLENILEISYTIVHKSHIMTPHKALYWNISNKKNISYWGSSTVCILRKKSTCYLLKMAFCHGFQILSLSWFEILHLKIFALLNSVGKEGVILVYENLTLQNMESRKKVKLMAFHILFV